MADYNIDDPFLLTTSQLRSRALEESRRRRAEASQKRRAEWERRNEEKERVRRVKEEWERESLLPSQAPSSAATAATNGAECKQDDEGDSDSSPDLMETPPSSPKYKSLRSRADSDRSDDERYNTANQTSRYKDKSTTKKSNSRYKLDRDSSDRDEGADRIENAPILRDGRFSHDSPRKWQDRADANKWQKQDSCGSNDYAATAPARKPLPIKKKPWQVDSSDESEVDVESFKARQQKQQSQPNDNRKPTKPKPTVTFSSKLATKKKHKFAESSSSSSEDEAALEARFKKRREEKNAKEALGNRCSSSSGDTLPKKFQDTARNRFSNSSEDCIPKKFEQQNATNRYSSISGDINARTAPSKHSKRSRLTQAESSSEDEAEMEHHFRKSMEEKRLKSYKRNPLSQAKKDDDDWRVKTEARLHVSDQGLVGKEIVLGSQIKQVKDSVSDLGGSQERPRIRRGQISSSDLPVVAAKKKPTEDDLWDDWSEDMKKAESDSDEVSKKWGRKATAKKGDWVDTNKKSVRSGSKKADGDSASPNLSRKRPSSSKKNDDAPVATKRTGRGRRPEPKEESEESAPDEEEENHMAAQLKPNFYNPKLGPPGPLEPYVLSKVEDRKPTAQELENGVITHQIPASMNRYLQDYQRSGIQFMYNSVIEGQGCVLGDDMGLGKTVQVISLIAALQKKTGTGLDKLKIQRLRRDVAKAVKMTTKARLDRSLGISTEFDEDRAFDNIERPAFAPILVIAPSSVVQNWVNEFDSWGHFNVSVYEKSKREKAIEDVVQGSNFIMIAAKSLLVRQSDFDNLLSADWKLIFVDEYHEFKNDKSQSYKLLEQLRDDMSCPIVGMTGTLMQNNHDELFTLIDLVRPGLLGDKKTFNEYTSKPIRLARAKDAKDDIIILGKQREEELLRTIKPAFVERKKEVVLKDSLTSKNEKVIFCELSDIQKKLYRHLLSLPDYEMLKMGNAPCGACNVNQQYFIGYKRMKTRKEQLSYQRRHKDELVLRKKCCFKYPYEGLSVGDNCEPGDKIERQAILWIQKHKKIVEDPYALPDGTEIVEDLGDGHALLSCKSCPNCIALSAMSKLHKVCSHPCLLQVDRTAPPGAETDKKIEFANLAFRHDILAQLPGGTIYRSDGIMDDHLKLSGKMRTLDYCLRRFVRKRDRVLVFSYSTATLDLIQQHVKTQGWSYLRLDGQTPTSTRQSLVDKFQKDEKISLFLISTRAGGLGLNLTAANKVIIFDVNWNPSYDEQAQDRSYRIGQENDVEVIRLVARGTIEEQMYARQVYKVQLKKQTLGGNIDGTNQPSIFKGVDKDDKRKGELFGLENLLMFRDGSFMQLLWKKTDNPNEAHDVNEIARYTEADMNKAIEDTEGVNESDNSDSEYEEVANKVKASGINHGDLFNAERGKARVAQGDDEFEEEMGGQSQMIHVATRLACENFDSDTGDEGTGDEGEAERVNPTKSKHVLQHVAEEIDLDPSPVKSSTAECSNQSSLEGRADIEPSRTASIPEESPPITQPTVVADYDRADSKPRSKVSIMGVVFEERRRSTVDKKAAKKKSGLYIPSYSKN